MKGKPNFLFRSSLYPFLLASTHCSFIGRNTCNSRLSIINNSTMRIWSFALSSLWLFQLVQAFSKGPLNLRNIHVYNSPTKLFDAAESKLEDFSDWTEERKAGLFQFLLRDLEVEGVPLLGCDGVAANKTLQGATWTVAGQLSENDFERKVCLILEDIPVKDINLFVEMFSKIKEDESIMDTLHDLRRFSLGLVGNGIGPALVLETQNRTDTEIAQYGAMKKDTPEPNEAQWRAATESFIQRTFPDIDVAYRFLGSSDVCDILSGYWNCICELEATEGTDSIVLSCPPGSGEESLARFAAVSKLINTMNSVYASDYRYDLTYFHPSYDNDKIQSEIDAGHIPPTEILRDIVMKEGSETLTDDQLKLQNYQRKSPLPGMIIERASTESGSTEFNYENSMRLANEGEEKLEEAHKEEIKLLS